MSKVRLFWAANLGVAVTRAIAEMMDAVRQETAGLDLRIAWVPPPNLHVTLKFLGYTNEEALPALRDRVSSEISMSGPFEVRAGGLGAFPNARHPRVVWVGIDDPRGRLAQLAAGIDEWMSELGFIKEERPFRAHLTLGRVKEGRGSLEELVNKYGAKQCGASSIREVVLYESKLRGRGAEYIARARIALGGAPAGMPAAQGPQSAQTAPPALPSPAASAATVLPVGTGWTPVPVAQPEEPPSRPEAENGPENQLGGKEDAQDGT